MRRTLPFLLIVLAACQTPSAPIDPPGFEDHLLATIPEGIEVFVPISFSRDGRVSAYVAQASDGYRAVRGTWTSRRLDAI